MELEYELYEFLKALLVRFDIIRDWIYCSEGKYTCKE